MKSIEELRKVLKSCTSEAGIEPDKFDTYWITADACDHLIDEIEAEIADNYMLLPVDADGVPIHLYDKLLKSTGAAESTYGEVVGISDDSVFFNAKQGWESNWSKCTRHVKPRTLEDVLRDVWKEALDYAKSDMWRNPDEVFAERADEIRELLGGDAS